MSSAPSETLRLHSDQDVVRVRQAVRAWMVEQNFNLVDQTKMVTATSELARNTVIHGRGGQAQLERVVDGERTGIRATFEDQGPGIADIEQAMKDGFSSGDGLGLGLGGSKRLASEFEIGSKPGQGTRVTITMWR